MVTGWDSWLFAVSQWGMWLAQLAIRSALLVLILEGLVLIGRGLSASTRHLCRTLTLLALLVLPVLALLLPVWRVPLLESPLPVWGLQEVAPGQPAAGMAPAPLRSEPVSVQNKPVVSIGEVRLEPGSVSTQPVQIPARTSPFWLQARGTQAWTALRSGRLLLAFLPLLWGMIALGLAVRLLVGLFCVRVASWQAQRVQDGPLYDRMSEVAGKLDFAQPVRLLTSSRTEVALSVGVLRPAVMLPSIANTWSAGRLSSILLHELSHAKRRDNLSNLIAEVACTVYWFNPIVWKVASALKIDRERACDDRVLRAGTRPSDYAGHLLEVARAVSQRRFWGALELSQSSVLKDRFQALLNPDVNRRTLSDSGLLGVFALVGLVTLSISTVHPWKPVAPLDSRADGMATQGGSGLPGGKQLRRAALSGDGIDSGFPDDLGLMEEEVDPGSSRPGVAPARSAGLAAQTATPPDVRQESQRRPPSSRTGAAGRRVNSQRLKEVSRLLTGARRTSPEPNVRGQFPFPSIGRVASIPTRRVQLGEPTTAGDSAPPPGDLNSAESDPTTVEIASFDLGTLGEDSRATDINDSGIVVGQSRTVQGVVHPFLWVRQIGIVDVGEEQTIHTRALKINRSNQVLCETFDTFEFRAYVWSAETGLNDIGALNSDSSLTVPQAMSERGSVVGSSRGSGEVLKAFFWSPDSGILDIGAPGWSEALDVNDHDEVVGYADNRAFIWSRQEGFRSVGPDSAVFSTATAINNLGQVVGWARDGEDEERAFIWTPQDGLMDLGNLSEEFPLSLAFEVSDSGVVVGHSLSRSSAQQQQEVRAFRWSLETGMANLGDAPVHSRIAMNSLGQVVGTSLRVQGSDNPLAFLWTEEGRVTLTATPEPALSSEAVALNNRGQVAGNTHFPSQQSRAFLWEVRFVPEQPEGE